MTCETTFSRCGGHTYRAHCAGTDGVLLCECRQDYTLEKTFFTHAFCELSPAERRAVAQRACGWSL